MATILVNTSENEENIVTEEARNSIVDIEA
jgi:hypothetical protein